MNIFSVVQKKIKTKRDRIYYKLYMMYKGTPLFVIGYIIPYKDVFLVRINVKKLSLLLARNSNIFIWREIYTKLFVLTYARTLLGKP
jgi:hypothetical protein